jgi:hypothetical protein
MDQNVCFYREANLGIEDCSLLHASDTVVVIILKYAMAITIPCVSAQAYLSKYKLSFPVEQNRSHTQTTYHEPSSVAHRCTVKGLRPTVSEKYWGMDLGRGTIFGPLPSSVRHITFKSNTIVV